MRPTAVSAEFAVFLPPRRVTTSYRHPYQDVSAAEPRRRARGGGQGGPYGITLVSDAEPDENPPARLLSCVCTFVIVHQPYNAAVSMLPK